MALALAMAVASGKPMFGRWEVGDPGPVLFIQEENAPWMMQDRMRKIAHHMGLIEGREAYSRQATAGGLGSHVIDIDLPDEIPLKLMNNYGFNLGVEEHRDMLVGAIEETIDELGSVKLLILDPLYLILDGNENNNGASVFYMIPSHTLWDTGLRGEYERFFWSFTVQNLFGVKYYDYALDTSAPGFGFFQYNFYPQPGRLFMARGGFNFGG